MITGVVFGIVEDNQDPERMNRVKVRFAVDGGDDVKSSWCRMIMPMAGAERGMVMLPDIGTEVVIGFAYRSMSPYMSPYASPYVLGAVYNHAQDKPTPYHNNDNNNDKRVFWSRSGHLVVFDDTDGAEKVGLGALASAALDVESAPIYDVLDSAAPSIKEHCDGDICWEARQSTSIKCTNFALQASGSVSVNAGTSATIDATASADFSSDAQVSVKGSVVAIN